jgi:hypothetical protein
MKKPRASTTEPVLQILKDLKMADSLYSPFKTLAGSVMAKKVQLPFSGVTYFMRRRKGKDTITAGNVAGESSNKFVFVFALVAQLTYREDGSMVRYEELLEMDGDDTDALVSAVGDDTDPTVAQPA